MVEKRPDLSQHDNLSIVGCKTETILLIVNTVLG